MKRNKTKRDQQDRQRTRKNPKSALVELTPTELDSVAGGCDPELIVGF